MKLFSVFFSITFSAIILGDPRISTCGGCTGYVTRIGELPDTTLTQNDVWKIVINEELFEFYNDCEDRTYDGFAPRVYHEKSNSNISVIQSTDTLIITASNKGVTELYLYAAGDEPVDADIVSQTLTITVN